MTAIVSRRAAGIRPRRLVTFVLIAYGGAWLVVLPLWLGDGLRSPYARLLLIAMMLTPAVAALVTVRLWPDGRKIVGVLGLRPGRFRRWWWTMLVAWFGPAVLIAASVLLARLLGRFAIDWGTWSALRASLGGRPVPMSMSTLLMLTIGSNVVVNVWLSAVFAVGEEIGWRGFLRDELSGLERWSLILVTGVVWGLWHAPIILLGYNYPGLPPVLALACMVVFTTLAAALLEWLRTVGTAIWPTALAHAAINTGSATVLLLVPIAAAPSPLWSGLLGWTGWLVMLLVVIVLVLTGALRWRARPRDEASAQVGADSVSSRRSGSVTGRARAGDPSPDPGASDGRS